MASTGDTWRLGRRQSSAVVRVQPTLREYAAPALIALVPVVLVLFATRHGLGVTPDSLHYLQPLQTGRLEFEAWWPAGLPLLLVLVGSGAGAVALNCAALITNLLSSYALARTVSGSRTVALAVTGWLALSVATTQVYAMLWSEPLFLAAINLALLSLARAMRDRGFTSRWLGVLVVAVNVACAVRWAGLFLLPVIAVTALCVSPGRLMRRAARAAAIGCACSVTLVAGWANNILTGQSLMGPRQDAVMSPIEVLAGLPRAVGGYTLNMLTGSTGELVVGTVVLTVSVGVVSVWLRRTSLRWHPALPLIGWCGIYLASVLGTSMTTVIDQLGFRLSSPALTGGVVLMASAAAAVLPRLTRIATVSALAWMGPTTAAWVWFASFGQPFAW